ncbi:MAG: hypothetical protein IIA60_07970 [Candidatus Marinimicrobia bacterium]|nr:hypothetical protein [Candidatus Neomarinimicrobiota bacterium]
MALEFRIVGDTGKNTSKRQVHVHPFVTSTGIHSGLVVLTHPLLELDPEFHPFLNDVNGTDMAINASFSGNAALINNGSTTTSAASGTTTSGATAIIHDTGATFTGSVSVGMIAIDSQSVYSHVTTVVSDIRLDLDGSVPFANGEAYTVGGEWPGTAVQGGWDFSGDISIASANNNDQCRFDNPGTSVMSNYVALTGKITLTTWNETLNELLVSFALAGVPVGNSVDLNDFIDTGLLGTQQNFVIPKADLGLTTQIIDEMDMVIVRTGGPRPVFRFDQLQWEQTGTPLVFTATTPADTRFHVTEIRIGLADDVTGIITGSTTTYPTMTGLAYNSLLGVSALSNGIIFARVQEDKTVFAVSLKQLSDFLATGSNLINMVSDGTNTFITLLVEFPEPIILDGSTGDNLSFTINDNLSGLLLFTAAARGAIEV